jgi:hypothetical protein
MNKQIELIKRHKSYNKSELDFILSRFKGNELMIKLIDLETTLERKDCDAVLRSRGLR